MTCFTAGKTRQSRDTRAPIDRTKTRGGGGLSHRVDCGAAEPTGSGKDESVGMENRATATNRGQKREGVDELFHRKTECSVTLLNLTTFRSN